MCSPDNISADLDAVRITKAISSLLREAKAKLTTKELQQLWNDIQDHFDTTGI